MSKNEMFSETFEVTSPVKETKKATVYTAAEADKRQLTLMEVYRKEERIPVRVAPSYAKYLGKLVRIVINGIMVTIPCNGKSISIPKSFAAEIGRRMSHIDKYEMRLQRMSNISANFETSMGMLSF